MTFCMDAFFLLIVGRSIWNVDEIVVNGREREGDKNLL